MMAIFDKRVMPWYVSVIYTCVKWYYLLQFHSSSFKQLSWCYGEWLLGMLVMKIKYTCDSCLYDQLSIFIARKQGCVQCAILKGGCVLVGNCIEQCMTYCMWKKLTWIRYWRSAFVIYRWCFNNCKIGKSISALIDLADEGTCMHVDQNEEIIYPLEYTRIAVSLLIYTAYLNAASYIFFYINKCIYVYTISVNV